MGRALSKGIDEGTRHVETAPDPPPQEPVFARMLNDGAAGQALGHRERTDVDRHPITIIPRLHPYS